MQTLRRLADTFEIVGVVDDRSTAVARFAGDDLTDEHGFQVINGLGGTSVLVGDRAPSAARYRLADTHAVLQWLQQGAEA